jgi:hypothetical protein
MSTPGSANHAQHVFARALSRTYTSNNPITPTSSVGTEEWRPIFEKLLEGAPPQLGTGKTLETIPLDRFREILEDDPLWSETIPKEMQERILASVDKDGDGAIGKLIYKLTYHISIFINPCLDDVFYTFYELYLLLCRLCRISRSRSRGELWIWTASKTSV